MFARLSAAALALAVLYLGSGSDARAQRAALTSGLEQTTVIELYTSEGCSSCPPADRWLSELEHDARLWRDFVPLAFHVDYWDYIGWRDRFAAADHSERQRRYAREGGANTVYTPGFFENGREWRGWWRGQRPANPDGLAGRLALNVDGKRASVTFKASGEPAQDLEVHVALLGLDLESQVTAGENDGRMLQHDFVVLGLESAPLRKAGDRFAAELELPDALVPAARRAVAAWVSAAGSQTPLQAVGGYLDSGEAP